MQSLTKCKRLATLPTYFLPAGVVSTCGLDGRFYPSCPGDATLLERNMKNPELRISPVPVGGHAVEDEAEIALFSGLERRR